MLEKSGAELDPTIFKAEHQGQFSEQLVDALQALEASNETIRIFQGKNETALGREWGLKIEDSGDDEVKEAYESLVEHGGEDLVHDLMGRISGNVDANPDEEEVTQEQYEAALERKGHSSSVAVDLLCGYKDFMEQGMVAAFGDEDDGTVEEQAWTATWRKLKEVLTEADGTLIVEAVTLIDEIAREKFGSDYDPQEYDRGPVVDEDICARTFYKVLQPHLPRATMRSGEDEWTGF